MTIDPPRSPPARRAPLLRRPWVLPLAVLSVAFVAFELPPYLTFDPARSRVPVLTFPGYYPLLTGHIMFGSIALLTACLQVWPRLRARHPRVHRWSGRLYVFAGAVPTSLATLVISPLSEWGPNKRVASTLLAVLWLSTSLAGWRAARARRYVQHREWMIRSFALAFAIVSNRIWWAIAVAALAHAAPTRAVVLADHALGEQVFGLSTWLSWVGNLLLAEWWLHRTRARRPAPRQLSPA